MLKTILIFCLLAFGTAQAAQLLVPDDYDYIRDALAGVADSDTIYVTQSVTDDTTNTQTWSYSAVGNILIAAYPGTSPTYTFTGITNSFAVKFGTNTDSMTIRGINWVNDHATDDGGLFQFYDGDGDPVTIEDCSFTCGGSSEVGAIGVGSSDAGNKVNIDITDCTFTGTADADDSSGLIVVATQNSTGLYLAESCDITSCTFTGGQYAIGTHWDGSLHNVTVDSCTFSGQTTAAIRSARGANPLSVTNSTFTNVTNGSSTIGGMDIDTHPDSTHQVDITGCTFTNATVDIGYGTTSTQPVNTGTISGCTFPADSSTYDIILRTVGTTVSGNTFSGTRVPTGHLLMLGSDSGYEIGDSLAIVVHDNFFNVTEMPDSAAELSYLLTACKAEYIKMYNNHYAVAEPPSGSTGNMALVSVPGGQHIEWYNNTFESGGWSDLQLIRLLNWSTTDVDSCSFKNNIYLGTYGDIIKMEHDDMTVGLDVSHNFFAGALTWDSLGVDVDITESTFADINYSDLDQLVLVGDWGGAVVSGITPTTAGLYPIGVQTAQKNDPVISRNQASMETPIKALEFLRTVGQTGIELDWVVLRDRADAMNLDIWLDATHPNGSGTWEAQAKDTLKVARIR